MVIRVFPFAFSRIFLFLWFSALKLHHDLTAHYRIIPSCQCAYLIIFHSTTWSYAWHDKLIRFKRLTYDFCVGRFHEIFYFKRWKKNIKQINAIYICKSRNVLHQLPLMHTLFWERSIYKPDDNIPCILSEFYTDNTSR